MDSLNARGLGYVVQLIEQSGLFVKSDGLYVAKSLEGGSGYADNFGLQWNTFRLTQVDSNTGLKSSRDRFCADTHWSTEDLAGRIVLEIGSGAGRFTEILLELGAFVVTVDMSSAIRANRQANLSDRAIFIQASFYDLPFFESVFDFVFCYGVAQHTPVPRDVYNWCITYCKNGGSISIDHYRKMLWPNPYYHPKYVWRILTTRMNPELLLKIVAYYIPKYIKFDTLLIDFLPKRVSLVVRGLIPIPCWNYKGSAMVSQDPSSLCEWAILDTFDALSAKYDFPASKEDIVRWISEQPVESVSIELGGNGYVLNCTKGHRRQKI